MLAFPLDTICWGIFLPPHLPCYFPWAHHSCPPAPLGSVGQSSDGQRLCDATEKVWLLLLTKGWERFGWSLCGLAPAGRHCQVREGQACLLGYWAWALPVGPRVNISSAAGRKAPGGVPVQPLSVPRRPGSSQRGSHLFQPASDHASPLTAFRP